MMNTTPNSNDDSIKALITQVTIQERHKADRTQYLLTLRNEDTKLNETLADISEKIESYNEELREIKIKIPEQVLKNQEAEEELTQQQVNFNI